MKRAKEWIIKELTGHEIGDYGNYYNSGYEDGLAYAIELAHQLDEPGKVIIPQFVADWIENVSGLSNSMSYLMTYDQIKRFSHELTLWCYESGNHDNLHKLARAWLDGYEVEKEKYYHVINESNKVILRKHHGDIFPTIADYDKHVKCTTYGLFKLTEKEIKDYDPRYWAFAVEVEE